MSRQMWSEMQDDSPAADLPGKSDDLKNSTSAKPASAGVSKETVNTTATERSRGNGDGNTNRCGDDNTGTEGCGDDGVAGGNRTGDGHGAGMTSDAGVNGEANITTNALSNATLSALERAGVGPPSLPSRPRKFRHRRGISTGSSVFSGYSVEESSRAGDSRAGESETEELIDRLAINLDLESDSVWKRWYDRLGPEEKVHLLERRMKLLSATNIINGNNSQLAGKTDGNLYGGQYGGLPMQFANGANPYNNNDNPYSNPGLNSIPGLNPYINSSSTITDPYNNNLNDLNATQCQTAVIKNTMGPLNPPNNMGTINSNMVSLEQMCSHNPYNLKGIVWVDPHVFHNEHPLGALLDEFCLIHGFKLKKQRNVQNLFRWLNKRSAFDKSRANYFPKGNHSGAGSQFSNINSSDNFAGPRDTYIACVHQNFCGAISDYIRTRRHEEEVRICSIVVYKKEFRKNRKNNTHRSYNSSSRGKKSLQDLDFGDSSKDLLSKAMSKDSTTILESKESMDGIGNSANIPIANQAATNEGIRDLCDAIMGLRSDNNKTDSKCETTPVPSHRNSEVRHSDMKNSRKRNLTNRSSGYSSLELAFTRILEDVGKEIEKRESGEDARKKDEADVHAKKIKRYMFHLLVVDAEDDLKARLQKTADDVENLTIDFWWKKPREEKAIAEAVENDNQGADDAAVEEENPAIENKKTDVAASTQNQKTKLRVFVVAFPDARACIDYFVSKNRRGGVAPSGKRHQGWDWFSICKNLIAAKNTVGNDNFTAILNTNTLQNSGNHLQTSSQPSGSHLNSVEGSEAGLDLEERILRHVHHEGGHSENRAKGKSRKIKRGIVKKLKEAQQKSEIVDSDSELFTIGADDLAALSGNETELIHLYPYRFVCLLAADGAQCLRAFAGCFKRGPFLSEYVYGRNSMLETLLSMNSEQRLTSTRLSELDNRNSTTRNSMDKSETQTHGTTQAGMERESNFESESNANTFTDYSMVNTATDFVDDDDHLLWTDVLRELKDRIEDPFCTTVEDTMQFPSSQGGLLITSGGMNNSGMGMNNSAMGMNNSGMPGTLQRGLNMSSGNLSAFADAMTTTTDDVQDPEADIILPQQILAAGAPQLLQQQAQHMQQQVACQAQQNLQQNLQQQMQQNLQQQMQQQNANPILGQANLAAIGAGLPNLTTGSPQVLMFGGNHQLNQNGNIFIGNLSQLGNILQGGNFILPNMSNISGGMPSGMPSSNLSSSLSGNYTTGVQNPSVVQQNHIAVQQNATQQNTGTEPSGVGENRIVADGVIDNLLQSQNAIESPGNEKSIERRFGIAEQEDSIPEDSIRSLERPRLQHSPGFTRDMNRTSSNSDSAALAFSGISWDTNKFGKLGRLGSTKISTSVGNAAAAGLPTSTNATAAGLPISTTTPGVTAGTGSVVGTTMAAPNVVGTAVASSTNVTAPGISSTTSTASTGQATGVTVGSAPSQAGSGIISKLKIGKLTKNKFGSISPKHSGLLFSPSTNSNLQMPNLAMPKLKETSSTSAATTVNTTAVPNTNVTTTSSVTSASIANAASMTTIPSMANTSNSVVNANSISTANSTTGVQASVSTSSAPGVPSTSTPAVTCTATAVTTTGVTGTTSSTSQPGFQTLLSPACKKGGLNLDSKLGDTKLGECSKLNNAKNIQISNFAANLNRNFSRAHSFSYNNDSLCLKKQEAFKQKDGAFKQKEAFFSSKEALFKNSSAANAASASSSCTSTGAPGVSSVISGSGSVIHGVGLATGGITANNSISNTLGAGITTTTNNQPAAATLQSAASSSLSTGTTTVANVQVTGPSAVGNVLGNLVQSTAIGKVSTTSVGSAASANAGSVAVTNVAPSNAANVATSSTNRSSSRKNHLFQHGNTAGNPSNNTLAAAPIGVKFGFCRGRAGSRSVPPEFTKKIKRIGENVVSAGATTAEESTTTTAGRISDQVTGRVSEKSTRISETRISDKFSGINLLEGVFVDAKTRNTRNSRDMSGARRSRSGRDSEVHRIVSQETILEESSATNSKAQEETTIKKESIAGIEGIINLLGNNNIVVNGVTQQQQNTQPPPSQGINLNPQQATSQSMSQSILGQQFGQQQNVVLCQPQQQQPTIVGQLGGVQPGVQPVGIIPPQNIQQLQQNNAMQPNSWYILIRGGPLEMPSASGNTGNAPSASGPSSTNFHPTSSQFSGNAVSSQQHPPFCSTSSSTSSGHPQMGNTQGMSLGNSQQFGTGHPCVSTTTNTNIKKIELPKLKQLDPQKCLEPPKGLFSIPVLTNSLHAGSNSNSHGIHTSNCSHGIPTSSSSSSHQYPVAGGNSVPVNSNHLGNNNSEPSTNVDGKPILRTKKNVVAPLLKPVFNLLEPIQE